MALFIYYFAVLVYNIFTQGYITANVDIVRSWGITNNLLDAPLVLFTLTYFSGSSVLTKRIKALILGVMLFELVIVSLRGFSVASITIILAPNLLIILGFCFYFFFRQIRITIANNKGMGKSLMVSSLLFAYGCYSIIYVMYYVLKTPHIADTFLVYFMVTTFSSFLMAAAIIIESKRIRKLEEVKIARKELLSIYDGNQKPAIIKSVGIETRSFN
jgi:hypothetical protein